jgi:hypothetical protein
MSLEGFGACFKRVNTPPVAEVGHLNVRAGGLGIYAHIGSVLPLMVARRGTARTVGIHSAQR